MEARKRERWNQRGSSEIRRRLELKICGILGSGQPKGTAKEILSASSDSDIVRNI